MTWATDHISSSSSRIASLITGADLTRQVPSCPEWTLQDLVVHLGVVQSSWARHVAECDPDRGYSVTVAEPLPGDDLAMWLSLCTSLLVNAVLEHDAKSPCWTWWGAPRTAGAVARHQVHEAAVHCWDVELTVSAPTALDITIAVDGVDEYLAIHASRLTPGVDDLIILVPTDSDHRWTLGTGSNDVTIHGTASDLALLLNGRRPLTDFDIDGPVEVATRWLSLLDNE